MQVICACLCVVTYETAVAIVLVCMRGSCMAHSGISISFPFYPISRPGGLQPSQAGGCGKRGLTAGVDVI